MAKEPKGTLANRPAGSAPSSAADPRPRAQISYEGEDEFSLMSLEPTRRKREEVDLEPIEPGVRKEVKVNDLKPKGGVLAGFIKKIFDR
jgi:hypothetical protein